MDDNGSDNCGDKNDPCASTGKDMVERLDRIAYRFGYSSKSNLIKEFQET